MRYLNGAESISASVGWQQFEERQQCLNQQRRHLQHRPLNCSSLRPRASQCADDRASCVQEGDSALRLFACPFAFGRSRPFLAGFRFGARLLRRLAARLLRCLRARRFRLRLFIFFFSGSRTSRFRARRSASRRLECGNHVSSDLIEVSIAQSRERARHADLLENHIAFDFDNKRA